MDSSKMQAKCLYKFLKKHRLLDIFIERRINYAITHFHGGSRAEVATNQFLADKDLIKYFISFGSSIGNAFIWSTTEEGAKFWNEKSDEFESVWLNLSKIFC